MSVKLYFLRSYLDYFLKNLGDLSEELGEHFHQEIRIREEHYQTRSNLNFLANNCCAWKKEIFTEAIRWIE